MTGIRSSDAAWLACALAAATAAADEVSLHDASLLSGNVTAIAENGGVTLETPLSPAPLALRGDAIRHIAFTRASDTAATGDTLVRLVNGDTLPGDLVALHDGTLTLATSYAGELRLPKHLVARLDLGIVPHRTIYQGPTTLEGWEADRWICQDNVFISQGNGRVGRTFELPRQFILRFHLAWRNNPNVVVGFAEPSGGDAKADRYQFLFNNSGMEVKRQRASDSRLVSLTTLNRPPEQFPDGEMDVEIRVDRRDSKLQLFIDNQLEARIDDPTGPPPAAGGVSFRSNVGGEAVHRISRLQLLSWDAANDRHRTEERGDPKTDALIDAEGGRYSGSLETIRSGPGGVTLRFKSPLLDQPMEIPATEVSTVFLASAAPPAAATTPLVLKLHGAGELRAERCTFDGDRLILRHPLLGEQSIKRGSLAAVERPTASPAPRE